MSLPDDESKLESASSETDQQAGVEPNTSGDHPDEVHSELEPFNPPVDFFHGEEFEAPTPRPIPKYLREGSHAKRSRGVIYSLIALGIMFVVFRPIPFVQALSFYILPLKWLHWIGLGLIAIGLWKLFANLVTSGRYEYVKNGEPFIGRVLDCQKVECGTTDVPAFCHVARVEYKHPDTDQLVVQDFAEPDQWSTTKHNQMSCKLSPSDYITLVRLPDKKESSTTVYGFLGLDPEREMILKNGQPMRGTSPFTAIMIAFLIGFIVLLCMVAFDVIMFSFPIGGDWKLPTLLAVAGLLVGGVLGILSWKRSESDLKSQSPIPSALGIGFLGAITLPIGFFVLNSRLDQAPTKLEPIEIVEFWNTTHNFIIRDYELEYKNLDGGTSTKKHLRFSQITRLYGSKYAAKEISPGRFGYPWLKGIHPIHWLDPEDTKVQGPLVEFQFDEAPPELDPEADGIVQMIPVIALNEEVQVPVPKELIQPEINYLKSQPGILSVEMTSVKTVDSEQ